MLVENGMLVGAERYDIQYQEEEEFECCYCEEMTPIFDCVEFENNDNDIVCTECLINYLAERADEYVDEYTENNAYEYYRHWKFDNMTKEEQLELLKKAFQANEQFDLQASTTATFEDRKAFCMEEEGFWDYVQKKLGGKEKRL